MEHRPEVQPDSVEDHARHIETPDQLPQTSDRPSDRSLRVTVTDDDIHIMQCVAKELERIDPDLKVEGFAQHAQAGVALAVEKKPDVALLDIHMSGADAFWAASQIIKQTDGKVKALFYTGFPRDHYLDRARDTGASGMLSKHSETMSGLINAMRLVKKGEQYHSPELANRFLELEGDAPKSRLALLSERELIVLKQLSAGKTNREIADSLDLGLRSIEKAVSDLKKALDIPTTNELLIFAANEGIVFPEINQGEREEIVPDGHAAGANGGNSKDKSAPPPVAEVAGEPGTGQRIGTHSGNDAVVGSGTPFRGSLHH